MTTGVKHRRVTEVSISTEGDDERRYSVECRCTIGADHEGTELVYSQYNPSDDDDADDDADGESLSVYDAADIWRSKGEDPDFMFGFDEDELRRAAED